MRAILGLFINLIFVSLPLAALALVFTGLVLVPLQPDLTGHCQAAMETCHDRWQLPAGFALVPLGALGFALLFGAISILFRWSRDAAQHFFSVWAARLLLAAVVLGLLLVALPYLVHWIGGNEDQATEPANGEHSGIIGGAAITLIAGIVAQLSHLLSSEPAKKDIGRARKAFGKLGKGARLAVTYAAAAVAGPALLFAIVVFVAAWALTYAHADSHVDMGIVAVGLGVLVLFGLLYSVVDLMTWSLHPFYKRRLSSVFALRRVSVATAKGGEDGLPTWESPATSCGRRPEKTSGSRSNAATTGACRSRRRR